jgi:hypothetical protein
MYCYLIPLLQSCSSHTFFDLERKLFQIVQHHSFIEERMDLCSHILIQVVWRPQLQKQVPPPSPPSQLQAMLFVTAATTLAMLVPLVAAVDPSYYASNMRTCVLLSHDL